MDRSNLLVVYRSMFAARQVDRAEQALTTSGEAFFYVACSGHEASACLAPHLTAADWLHCHYRDKALLLARGLPLRAFFDTLLCKDHDSSRGRQMSGFWSDPDRHILSMATPTGNCALQAVGVAAAVRDREGQPVVYCGVGDGTTQQGEYLEAVGEAVRRRLPVLFVVQDNRYAISTPTAGSTFFSLPSGRARDFLGLPIEDVDGRDPATAIDRLGQAVAAIRADRAPRLLVLSVERLSSHTSADDQRIYRDADELAQAELAGDPVRNLRQWLLAAGVAEAELAGIEAELVAAVAEAQAAALAGPEPAALLTAKAVVPAELVQAANESAPAAEAAPLTIREALNGVLRERLAHDERVVVYGQDIADPKGDVFGVTRGLSAEFPQRVFNAPLTESTIVGTGIGRALAGQRPVVMIQFADFLPLAYNQLVSELAMLHWRADGQWPTPLIVLAPCGGYRPGLGPYHAQTMDGTFAHVPGLDVFMPSTAADAAGLLRAAFRSARPTLLLYPKALLNSAAHASPIDAATHVVPLGVSRRVRSGRDLTFVGWGNTVGLCERAAAALEAAGADAEVVDLRSLSPWDHRAVLASAERTRRLIVVHEDSHTGGFGAEVLATVAEQASVPVTMRRIARPDTHVPCNFANQIEVLPSYRAVLEAAAQMLEFELTWKKPREQHEGVVVVEAIGSGPSDEAITVAEIHVQPGQQVASGDVLASVEAAKSVFDVTSPVAGQVQDIAAGVGDSVPVGEPLLRIRVDAAAARRQPVTAPDPGEPVLTRRRPASAAIVEARPRQGGGQPSISRVRCVTGARRVDNREVTSELPPDSDTDVFRLTGIESRQWVDARQTPVSLAVQAARELLAVEELSIDDVGLLVCSTTTPTRVSPSMACQVLNGLAGGSAATLQAFDINAACSGYLYALQIAYDYLLSAPAARVLVVTTEVLSPLLDRQDPHTVILFGDAASATLVYGAEHQARAAARLLRPELSARGEDGSVLSVPLRHDGFIRMNGPRVFQQAVRTMISSLQRICQREGIAPDQLKLVVPHQANQRILDAIESRIGVPVFSNIRRFGNTSSSSIPLCLDEVLPAAAAGDRLGLCAFGAGFTFGAGILQVV